MLPDEILEQIELSCDIDTRMKMREAFGWEPKKLNVEKYEGMMKSVPKFEFTEHWGCWCVDGFSDEFDEGCVIHNSADWSLQTWVEFSDGTILIRHFHEDAVEDEPDTSYSLIYRADISDDED